VTERGETGVGSARGRVSAVLPGQLRTTRRSRLPVVWRPSRSSRSRPGDPDKDLGTVGVGLSTPQPRGLGPPGSPQSLREPLAAAQAGAARVSVKIIYEIRPEVDVARRDCDGRRSAPSAARPETSSCVGASRCDRSHGGGDRPRDGCTRGNRPVMARVHAKFCDASSWPRSTTSPATRLARQHD